MGTGTSSDVDLMVHQEHMKGLKGELESFLKQKQKAGFDRVLNQLSQREEEVNWSKCIEKDYDSRQNDVIRDEYKDNFKWQLRQSVSGRKVRQYMSNTTYKAFSEREDLEKKDVEFCTMDLYCPQPNQCHRRHRPSLKMEHHPQYHTIYHPPSPCSIFTSNIIFPWMT